MWDWLTLNYRLEFLFFYLSPYERWTMHENMKKHSRAGYRFRCPGVTWSLAQGYSGDGSPDAEFETLSYNTRKPVWVQLSFLQFHSVTPLEQCLLTVIWTCGKTGQQSIAFAKMTNSRQTRSCSFSYSPWSAAAVWWPAGRVVGHQRLECRSHIVVLLVWDSD